MVGSGCSNQLQLAQGRQHCKNTGGHVHSVIDVPFVAGRCSGEGTALGVQGLCDNYNHLLYNNMHAKY